MFDDILKKKEGKRTIYCPKCDSKLEMYSSRYIGNRTVINFRCTKCDYLMIYWDNLEDV